MSENQTNKNSQKGVKPQMNTN